MRNLANQLVLLGLSPPEASVYLTLVELGGGKVSDLASHARIERTNCYYVLKTLSERGLISTTNKGAHKYYVAERPEKVVELQQQKLALAQQILPQLMSLEQKTKVEAPKMRYHEGLEAVTELLYSSLASSTELLCYTNIRLLLDKFGPTILDYFRKQASLNLSVRIISPNEESIDNFPDDFFPAEYLRRHLQLILVNPREFRFQDNVFVFENKVIVLSLNPRQYLGVLIESDSYADTSRTIFNLSWLGATTFVAQ